MAIDPKLVSIKTAGELPSGIPTPEGEFLYYEDNTLKKAEMSDLYNRVELGINGEALTTTTPGATGFERYIVHTAGTYTNFIDSNAAAIEVTAADLDGNLVYLEVTDGVAKKVIVALPSNTAKIVTWTASAYTSGSQVVHEGKIYESNAATAAGDVPGVSSKWVLIGGLSNEQKTQIDFYFPTPIPSGGDEVDVTLINGAAILTSNTVDNTYANWVYFKDFAVTQGQSVHYQGYTPTNGSKPMATLIGIKADNSIVVIIASQITSIYRDEIVEIPVGVIKISGSLRNLAGDTPNVSVFTPTSVNYPPIPIEKIANGKTIINKSWGAIGTSITYQDGKNYTGTPTGVSGIAKGYQTRIKEVFEFTTYTNYGYSGNSLGGLTTGDTSSILNKTGWVAHDIFTMESITNDFKRNIPIGTITDYNDATGITTYYGALRAFKDKVLALNASAIIIVANALKRNNAGYTSTSANSVGHTLLDYEKALLQIAKLNDWKFIDQNRESGINDDNLNYTTTDGLHPNDFGYRLISKVWIREFWLISKTNP